VLIHSENIGIENKGIIKMNYTSDYSKIKIFLNGKELELTSIDELKITGKINEHAKLNISAVLLQNNINEHTKEITSFSTIKVILSDGNNSSDLFNGVVAAFEVKSLLQVGYITIEALSNSYLLDIKNKNRSFQNKSITYEKLGRMVIKDYSSGLIKVTDSSICSKETGRLYVQYNETDWQFLKRLASNFNEGLVPAIKYEGIRVFFGLEKVVNRGIIDEDVVNFSVLKDLNKYNYMAQNHKEGLSEEDFVFYQIQCKRIMDIGDIVSFKNKTLYVSSFEIIVENAVVKYKYNLVGNTGLSQKKIYNDKLAGTSLSGEVISVSKHDVMVKLSIDEKQSKDDAYWFPYSTVFSTKSDAGWYFMPEVGDGVRVYFSDNKEENAVAINAIPIEPEQKDPNIRYISTKYGKEIKLTPDGIYITGIKGQVYISLSDNEGIQISSDNNIAIVSKQDIVISSQKKVDIFAEKINISGPAGSKNNIKIGDDVQIKGKLVKVNEGI
jgi:hypothetical protein